MEQRTKYEEPTVKAERRGVYEFFENDGSYRGKLCLVISNEDRAEDNLVSILILSEKTDKFNRDCVDVPVSPLRVLVARCGLVTYCRRSNLGCKVYEVSKHTMSRINAQIKIELGFDNRRHGEVWSEPDYKKLYEDLLSAISNAKTN